MRSCRFYSLFFPRWNRLRCSILSIPFALSTWFVSTLAPVQTSANSLSLFILEKEEGKRRRYFAAKRHRTGHPKKKKTVTKKKRIKDCVRKRNVGRSKWQCPKCGWNKWHPRYRIDMSLRHGNAVLLLEFKRLRPDNVTDILSGANMELWRAKRCDAAADRALAGQGCMLNAAVCYHHTLKELEDSAQRQCRNYKSILTAKGLSVRAFTVVHWTQFEDCPSALLVQEVMD